MTISSQDKFCSRGNDVTKPSSASSLADSQNISKRLRCRMMAYPEIAIIGLHFITCLRSSSESQSTKIDSYSLDSYIHSELFIRKIALHYDNLFIMKYL